MKTAGARASEPRNHCHCLARVAAAMARAMAGASMVFFEASLVLVEVQVWVLARPAGQEVEVQVLAVADEHVPH